MHIILDYDAEVSVPFSETFFVTIAKETLRNCMKESSEQSREIHISVTCVSEEKIAELNKSYRGIHKVTDVLSFGEYETKEAFDNEKQPLIFLGEIFLCPTFIQKASLEDGVTFEREMTYIFSHGILHLVGFDHEEAMFMIQESVTDALTGKKEYTKEEKKNKKK